MSELATITKKLIWKGKRPVHYASYAFKINFGKKLLNKMDLKDGDRLKVTIKKIGDGRLIDFPVKTHIKKYVQHINHYGTYVSNIFIMSVPITEARILNLQSRDLLEVRIELEGMIDG